MNQLDKVIRDYENRVLETSASIVELSKREVLDEEEMEILRTDRQERTLLVEFLENLYEIKFQVSCKEGK